MFLRNAISFLATLAIVAWFAGDAAAQFQRSRQQTGALGATQVNALGGNTFGVQAGQFGAGQQQRFGGQQFGGQQPGGNQFGQPGGQQAVPGSADAMRQAFQNMSGRQRRRARFDFIVESLNEMRDRRERRDRRRRRPDPVRVSVRPAFTVAPLDSQQLAGSVQQSLSKSIELEGSSASTQVTVDNGVATVTGSASSDYEAAVLARMVSLKPGVSEVVNQITVTGSGAESPSTSETLLLPAPAL